MDMARWWPLWNSSSFPFSNVMRCLDQSNEFISLPPQLLFTAHLLFRVVMMLPVNARKNIALLLAVLVLVQLSSVISTIVCTVNWYRKLKKNTLMWRFNGVGTNICVIFGTGLRELWGPDNLVRILNKVCLANICVALYP